MCYKLVIQRCYHKPVIVFNSEVQEFLLKNRKENFRMFAKKTNDEMGIFVRPIVLLLWVIRDSLYGSQKNEGTPKIRTLVRGSKPNGLHLLAIQPKQIVLNI